MGFGAVTVDDLIYVEPYPLPDTKVRVLAERRFGGGLVGTALVAAARLGARAGYCGVLGDDDLSRYTLREFEREGVDCSAALIRPGARPIHSTIIVEAATGQRSIMPSFENVAWRAPAEIDASLVAQCRVLFVDHHACEGSLHAVELAQARGIPVVADVERLDDPLARAILERADHLIVGIAFAGELTGQANPAAMAAALAGPSRACAVVTAGDRGCWYSAGGAPVRHVPAFAVKVVDTTGCGDVFHGAYAAFIAQGDPIGDPIGDAIRRASAAAAIKATQPGGRQGIPTRAALDSFLGRQAVHIDHQGN